MNTIAKTSFATLLLAAAAGSALAETPTVVNEPFVSSRSRAEVQAELADYQRAGVNPWSTRYNPLSGFRTNTTREAVTAAYIASRDQVAAFTGEDSGSAFLARARVPGLADPVLAGTPANAQ
jgi:hypothetical protein